MVGPKESSLMICVKSVNSAWRSRIRVVKDREPDTVGWDGTLGGDAFRYGEYRIASEDAEISKSGSFSKSSPGAGFASMSRRDSEFEFPDGKDGEPFLGSHDSG